MEKPRNPIVSTLVCPVKSHKQGAATKDFISQTNFPAFIYRIIDGIIAVTVLQSCLSLEKAKTISSKYTIQ